jgi:Spy/CpxP family protein refolding chaperone
MSRLRITFMTAALVLALAALTLNSLAQPPGRGGGGGFGGPGGGFGGPGGSLLQLASNPGVQADMKVTEKQKSQIKSLNDNYGAQTKQLRDQMGGPGGRGQGGGGNGNPNGQNGPGGGFGGGQGQFPNDPAGGAGGGGGGGRGNRGNRNQNGQGIPVDPEVAAARAAQFQMMREAMTELRQSAETSLGRILNKAQVNRLKQIQLQLEGPEALVRREDVQEKLNIDEAQVAMMQEIVNENRNLGRETGRARRDMMKVAFARINPNPGNDGQDGGNGNGGIGGNNGNGNNGGGRGGRGNFNPEAMKKVMEDPQVKAQMEQIQNQEQKLSAQFAVAVNKVLTPRQRSMYKQMLGPPFDRSQMGGGGPWGGRGGFGPGANRTTTKSAAAAKTGASDNEDDDETPKAKSTTAAPAKAKPATAPKRKSLRELRGEPPSDGN